MNMSAQADFNRLRTAERGAIAFPVKPRTPRRLATDANLFFDGDEARFIYEIRKGVLRSTKTLSNGEQQVVAFGYPGDFVGFPSAGRHTVDCRSLSPAKVVPHRIDHLTNPSLDPILHRRLVEAALAEMSQMQEHFLMLGRKSALEKVASFLGAILDRDGVPIGHYYQFHLPMCRLDIADFLGLTVETVSRTMTTLRSMEVILLENVTSVIVLDHEKLRALSERP